VAVQLPGKGIMDCCQCKGIETLFNKKEARNNLKAYRKHGPAKTTRILLEALKNELAKPGKPGEPGRGIEATTLLDIGGGIGAIQHELLRASVERATSVEASAAFLKAAQEEAERQGHAERVSYYHANFVDIAPQIPAADIVTLDRVICCYHDMQALVGLSVAKASMLYGLVYPRDTWWMRAGVSISNLYFRIVRNPFRVYIHRPRAVDSLVRDTGLQERFYKTSGPWQVVVYAR
jgi:2-polyprenyl-3-methyl-5-hydroxy-6-metoxy-1,4-benzoquinol methylase